MRNTKFVIYTTNPQLLALFHKQIDKMMKKKFKHDFETGRAILMFGKNSIEIIATDTKLQKEFEKSFKKNTKGLKMVNLLQKRGMSDLLGGFKMQLVDCD